MSLICQESAPPSRFIASIRGNAIGTSWLNTDEES